jgi:hypothetical protein
MKTLKYILVLMVATVFFSCQKDPLKEINDGSWNKEKNIISISFSDQIGKTTIVRTDTNATITFLDFAEDFSAIEITSLEVSYGATASVAVGQKLDFNNPEKTTTIIITPVNGEPLTWTIKAGQYVNPYKGTWGIQSFKFKWDDWNGWGLQGEATVASKMTSATAGNDDIITFSAIEGADVSGIFYGSYERTKGTDGAYGSYKSPAGTDWSDKFGQLPNGKGKYYINPDNSVSIEVEGSSKKLTSVGTTASTATTMTYDLNAQQIWTIDWNDYYGTENQLKMAYKIWYILIKQ